MAELNLLAFLQNALTTTASEQGTLENLLYSRLLVGNFKINSSGVVSFQFSGQFADGAVNAPSLTFASETTSGRYRIGANNIGESINGLKVIDWTASRLQLTGLNLIWGTDNAQDIGASGANRPRDLFLGRNATIGGTLAVTSTSVFTGAVTLTTPLGSASGGTSSAFFAISGPSALRTYALPDASATILTSNAAVTVAQGGTALVAGTSGGVLAFTGSTTLASSAALGANTIVLGGGAGVVPFTDANFAIEQTGHTLTFSTQPRASVWNSAVLSVANATETALAFDTNIDAIPATIHSTSSNQSRCVVPVGAAGFYLMIGSTTFASNATGSRYVYFKKNGTTGIGPLIDIAAQASGPTALQVATMATLAAGDYVELIAFQNSGGALNAGGTVVGNGGASQVQFVKLW